MNKKITIEIISALLALLFVYAAVSKLMNMEVFRFQLSRAPYFGKFADLLAAILPVSELIIVTLLLWSKTRYFALWASFISMLVFTFYVSLLLLSGKHLPCTCGGLIQKLKWHQHLIFNIAFSVFALIGIILYRKQNHINQPKLIEYHFSAKLD